MPSYADTTIDTAHKLSFCIPVYNQPEYLRECVAEILKYQGNDIEVIIQDNASTMDICSVAKSFHDARVRYFCNSENLGQDLNIIESFRNANSRFAFLLRTKDHILPEGIPLILERLEQAPDTAYLTGSCIDEDDKPRLTYTREHYDKGNEAMAAHQKLYIHPSGSAYCVPMLELDAMEAAVRATGQLKMSFLVHVLSRMTLAQRGNFEIIRSPIWRYTHTIQARDVAVNRTNNNKSVYTPSLQYMRYMAEMSWISEECFDEYRLNNYKFTFDRYLSAVTYLFLELNNDPNVRAHYGCEKEAFNLGAERKKFLLLTRELANNLTYATNEDKEDFLSHITKSVPRNQLYGCIRYVGKKINRYIPSIYTFYRKLKQQRI